MVHGLKHNAILAVATTGVLGLLWILASDSRWQSHIVVDPVVYWQRATAFFSHGGSWSHLGMNEYQPGALWFFAAVGWLAGAPGEFGPFLRMLFYVNLGLLAAHVVLARWAGPPAAPWWMLVFALLTGPILLCRFELWVSLLVLVAWVLWARGRLGAAAVLLGVATATKIYPVLLLPFLAADAWSRGSWRPAGRVLAMWGCGGFFVLGALGLWGSEWKEVRAALDFHFDKPFGIEGLLGSGVPLVQWMLGIPLRMAPRNGIYGFESDLGGAATFALEWLWVAPAVGIFLLLWRRGRGTAWSEAGVIFVLFGWYVTLGKLMAPQYVWWALPFLALTPSAWFGEGQRMIILLLLGASLVLGQVVYPLNYSEFLECFNGVYTENRMFRVNVAKNLLWLGAILLASAASWRRLRV